MTKHLEGGWPTNTRCATPRGVRRLWDIRGRLRNVGEALHQIEECPPFKTLVCTCFAEGDLTSGQEGALHGGRVGHGARGKGGQGWTEVGTGRDG